MGKKITLSGDSKEEIIVLPRKSIFSKTSKIVDCSDKGCSSEEISKTEKERLDGCSFAGSMKNDPNSRVNVHMCDESGETDIAIISDKVHFALIHKRNHET